MQALFSSYKLLHKLFKELLYSLPFTEIQRARLTRGLSHMLRAPYRFVQQTAPMPLHFEGMSLWYRRRDRGDWSIVTPLLRNELYEQEVVRELQRLLKPGTIFVDGGAHIGYFSMLGGKLVGPHGHVYAFEPFGDSFDLLQQNVTANNLAAVISPINLALADTTKVLEFVAPAGSSVSVKIEVAHAGIEQDSEQQRLKLQATSLDEYFEPLGFPEITLVKLDIEGAEILAFKGMEKLLHRQPRLRLITEFNLNNLLQMKTDPRDFFEPLLQAGFNRFRVLSYKGEFLVDPVNGLDNLIETARYRNINLLCERADD